MHYGNRLVKYARNTFNIIKKEAVQEVNLWINGQCTLINEQERQKLVPITRANEKTIKSNIDKFFQAHLYLAKLWPHFQAIPFTTRLVPGYITIDTSLLNVVFRLKCKSITEHRFDIWNTVFNLNDRAFLKSKHGFSWMLQTDGVGASILFMRKECVERHEAKKKNRTNARHGKPKVELPPKINLEAIVFDDYYSGQKGHLVGIDPGVNTLLFCNDGENILRYSRRQRNHESHKRQYYAKRPVNDLVYQMSQFNTKATNIDEFKLHSTFKEWHLHELVYHDPIHGKLNWYSWINRTRSEDQFCQRFKNDFGKDAIACLGDSSRKQCFKWQISKGVGLRKVFYRNGIKCFLIDKKYTSKRCGVCGDGTELDVARINENKRSAHTLLQCSKSHFCESGGRQTFMHRDGNGSLNMLRIAKCY